MSLLLLFQSAAAGINATLTVTEANDTLIARQHRQRYCRLLQPLTRQKAQIP
jgi:hypothetical protein